MCVGVQVIDGEVHMHPISHSVQDQMKQRRRRRGWAAQTCLSDKYVMSYNLLNEGHLDHNDTSMGLALFVERYPARPDGGIFISLDWAHVAP